MTGFSLVRLVRGLASAVVVAAVLCSVSAPARAGLLGITLQTPGPDVATPFGFLIYDGTGTLDYLGVAATFTPDLLPPTPFAISAAATPNYLLTAQVDNAGNFLSGSFTITGALTGWSPPIPDGLLLSGTLTALGFDGSILDATFTPTGGALLPYYTGTGGMIFGVTGVIDFSSSFTFLATNDTGIVPTAVPEPATLISGGMGLALVGLGALRRRRGAQSGRAAG